MQVLLPPAEGLLGSVVQAHILSASRWSVVGEVQTDTGSSVSAPPRQLQSNELLTASASGSALQQQQQHMDTPQSISQASTSETQCSGESVSGELGSDIQECAAEGGSSQAGCGTSCECIAQSSVTNPDKQQQCGESEPAPPPEESAASAGDAVSPTDMEIEVLSRSAAQPSGLVQIRTVDGKESPKTVGPGGVVTALVGRRTVSEVSAAVSSSRFVLSETSVAIPELPVQITPPGDVVGARHMHSASTATAVEQNQCKAVVEGSSKAAIVEFIASVVSVDALLMGGVLLGLSGTLIAGLLQIFKS